MRRDLGSWLLFRQTGKGGSPKLPVVPWMERGPDSREGRVGEVRGYMERRGPLGLT
jgi:hypothetical protein